MDFSPTYLKAQLRGDWSTPDFLNSEFCFGRYQAVVETQFRSFVPGLTNAHFSGGTMTGIRDVQTWFVIDHGTGGPFDRRGFATLNEINFAGSRASAITVEHNFGKRSLALTHLPFISKLPFSVAVRGGAFWIDDHGICPCQRDEIRVAKTAYTEAGFSIGNLSPFLSPFNLRAWFNWQLSAYDTRKSTIGFDFAF